VLLARSVHSIVQQHRPRHRANATGDRGDRAGDGFRALVVNIADELIPLLGIRIDTVDTHVNDGRPFVEHCAIDELRDAGGGDDDIGCLRFGFEIVSAGVTDRRRCVALWGFLDEQISEGFADDIRTADDDHIRARSLDLVGRQQFLDAVWGTGLESRVAGDKSTDVFGVETVNVLAGSIARMTARLSTWSGTGNCTKIP